MNSHDLIIKNFMSDGYTILDSESISNCYDGAEKQRKEIILVDKDNEDNWLEAYTEIYFNDSDIDQFLVISLVYHEGNQENIVCNMEIDSFIEDQLNELK